MRSLLLTAVAVGMATAAPLGAQVYPYIENRVAVGARVRLGVASVVTRAPTELPSKPVVGTVRAITPDTVYLDLPAPPRTIVPVPRILIQRVERSLGPPSRLESAREAGLFGAVVLGLLVAPLVAEHTGLIGGTDQGRIAGIGIGFIAGALVGAARPYERWRGGWIPE